LSGGSAVADAVPVICGPTAAGKSSFALVLAERYGRPILVADSRQVYRRFDLGTAKPDAADRGRARHLGIDLVEPTERFSAAQWSAVAAHELEHGDANGPIIVGGTGMYLRALFEGLFDDPSSQAVGRPELDAWMDQRSTEELRRWTGAIDPDRAHLGRTQLLRALSVAFLTGHRISDLHGSRARNPRWRPEYLVIDPGPALHGMIERRLDAMLAAGWLDEVRSLADLPDDAPAWKSTGYRALRDVARGTSTQAEARERILIETRQYAKRQRTWFRHQLPPDQTTRIDPTTSDAMIQVDAWLSRVTA
jgi:tRNA dimethylallyltransferase